MVWAEQLQSVGALEALGCVLGAYALGCFSTGYYLVRARTGQDVRSVESGSTGARNVARTLGKGGFLITFLGDFGKGALAVWAVRHFSGSNLLAASAMIFVLACHVWPVTLQFRGGKGAATSLGALLVYDPQLAFAFLVCCLPGVLFLRRITLPGMVAYVCLPAASYWLHHDSAEATMLAGMAAVVVFAHRQNLAKEFSTLTTRRDLTVKPQPPKS